ncbi:MAG: winged helix-turn-helix transcriptional regulator, partial [Candidatus Thorarchaeota archaeon]
MSKPTKDFENHLMKIWMEVSQEIADSLGLAVSEVPIEIRLSSNENEVKNLNPGTFQNGMLVINSNFPDVDSHLSTIITKLCFQSSLPTDLLCEECIDDLSFEFARRRIKNDTLRDEWEEIWAQHSPAQRISTVLGYDPSNAYKWLHSVAGDEGLNTIVREIAHRAKNHVPLSFEDYLIYFNIRIRRFVSKLDKTELKLVKYLIENPTINVRALSTIVGVSTEWVSRKISDLQKRMILRKF